MAYYNLILRVQTDVHLHIVCRTRKKSAISRWIRTSEIEDALNYLIIENVENKQVQDFWYGAFVLSRNRKYFLRRYAAQLADQTWSC